MAAERRQKGKQMDKEERKKIHKKISIITLLALLVVIAVMIGGTLMGWLKIWAFQLIACLYLVGYWAATDILEPKLTKLLEGVTEDQKKAYKKYAAMDFAGYMGILVFGHLRRPGRRQQCRHDWPRGLRLHAECEEEIPAGVPAPGENS